MVMSERQLDQIAGSPAPRQAVPRQNDKHIVDQLIEERARKLMRSPLWPLYKRIIYPILLYRPAVKMADDIADLDARGVFDYMSDLLDIDLTVTGLEHVPSSGRVLIAPTHPAGIPDGTAIFDAIKSVRTDITFFANRDAIRAAPGIAPMIIPVVWREEERSRKGSRETLIQTKEAFEAEKCVVLFPSGRIARMGDDKKLIEQDWLPSLAAFARKYDCAVVPAHIEMRNSWLYYWFWKVNEELRDMTLFHELLNKKRAPYKVTFGKPVKPEELNGTAQEASDALRAIAVGLGE